MKNLDEIDFFHREIIAQSVCDNYKGERECSWNWAYPTLDPQQL